MLFRSHGSVIFIVHTSLSFWYQTAVFLNFFSALFTDEFDSYIVVSFINATLVLSIGETVEEVTDSGFLGTTPTLSCSQLGEEALLQVQCTLHLLVLTGNWNSQQPSTRDVVFFCVYFLRPYM